MNLRREGRSLAGALTTLLLSTANGRSNDVSIIDPATGEVLKRSAPWGIAVSPGRRE